MRMVPYVPKDLSKETRDTFEAKEMEPRRKALIQLVFAPSSNVNTEEVRDTAESRGQFDCERQQFVREQMVRIDTYTKHEERAQEYMARAVRNLPAELYEEAISSEPQQLPKELQFHELYRNQWFNALSDEEKRELQCYQNLMHVRYPHSAIKKSSPHLFWINENNMMNRSKEAAMKKAKPKVQKKK